MTYINLENEFHDNLVFKSLEIYNVDPTAIYCQTTGQKIGSISSQTFAQILSMLPFGLSEEEILDELFVRTICSMRPSPHFNFIRKDTYRQFAAKFPQQFCAFLLGRFYRPKHASYNHLKRTSDEAVNQNALQIKIFNSLQSINFNSPSGSRFLHWLITLDNLFDLSLIKSINDFPNDFKNFSATFLSQYCDALENCCDKLAKQKNHLEHQAKLHNSWMNAGGHKAMSGARIDSFYRQAPLTPAKIQALQKVETEQFMRKILSDILRGIHETTQEEKPVELPRAFKFGQMQIKS